MPSEENIYIWLKEKNIQSFLKILGFFLKQIHIELIERLYILSTLWNWIEDWKSSQVQSSFCFEFHCIKVRLLILCFLKLRCCMLSYMNKVDPFIFCCIFFYEIQNCIFPFFSNSQLDQISEKDMYERCQRWKVRKVVVFHLQIHIFRVHFMWKNKYMYSESNSI